ncbi:hypothetical protein AXF42_Ash016975 [Apostasia shenzhenica]|uniref:Uncharacterized protein n=1 Tax=Apostasia shenzhenica TaxID=1088818 RepID=A0A2I0B7F6_9ASPA|nr:hypothetical protein AXF42_Ash016975 [Apostasia shenzhenica]
MGGGGVIRSAAKAAAYGAFRSPLVDEAGRRAARQQVAAFQSAAPAADSGLIFSADKEQTNSPGIVAVSHWPEWEFDDWEVTGGSDGDLGSKDVAPRQVFGPIPSLEEAKSATADLKNAIEKVYFEPSLNVKSQKGSQSSTFGETSAVSAVPKHVSQMFSLLQGSPEAQDVVASLACDKKVWDAVMKNEKVMEFCRNPPQVLAFQTDTDAAESIAGNESPHRDVKEFSKASRFTGFVEKIKVSVLEIVSNITDYIQDLFRLSPKDSSSSSADMTAIGGFLALAVAAILVIVLKRG